MPDHISAVEYYNSLRSHSHYQRAREAIAQLGAAEFWRISNKRLRAYALKKPPLSALKGQHQEVFSWKISHLALWDAIDEADDVELAERIWLDLDDLGLYDPRTEGAIPVLLPSVIDHFHQADTGYRRRGGVYYELAAPLQRALLPENTRIRDLPTDLVIPPYDALYIHFASPLNFTEKEFRSKYSGAWVFYDPEDRRIGIHAFGSPFSELGPLMAQLHATMRVKLELSKFKTMDQFLETAPSISSWKEDSPKISGSDASLLIFITNILVYLTTREADVVYQQESEAYRAMVKKMHEAKTHKKKEKLKVKVTEMARAQIPKHIVGGSYTIKRWGSDEEPKEGTPGPKRKLKVTTLVSGHWRNQACGAGRKDHRLIWIQPFWRGPKGGPISQRQRKVK